MTNSPSVHSSLENLKKQAKTLLKQCRAHHPRALARLARIHPRFAPSSTQPLPAASPKLADCQLALAREAGFSSWPQLKVAMQAGSHGPAHQFVEIACLCHDDPHFDHRSFHLRAHEMLRNSPGLAEANIWSAATAGNTRAVQTLLDAEPELVNAPGPHGWSPLLCACYSRVKPLAPEHSTFAVAQLLLDRGADPNTHTWKGNADERLSQTARRFTALTGVFGGGSTGFANQPPHERWRELADLLLTRGADPADEQALAINQDASLELLLRHGLKPDAMSSKGVTLLGRALAQAARKDQEEQVRLLLAHGCRTDEHVNGKLPWDHAMQFGHLEIALLLETAGAPRADLNEVERFVSLCMAGDETSVRTLLAQHPDLLARAPSALVKRAVSTARKQAVRLVLELGFDPNFQDDNGAIHLAGTLAENEEILRLLLAGGASLQLRDPWYDGTGIGWADFFDYPQLRDRLLDEPGISLFDALDFQRFDRVSDILTRDPAALERPFAACISREPQPADYQTPLLRSIARGQTEAVRLLLAHGADTQVRDAAGLSPLALARRRGFTEIVQLLAERAE